MIQAVGVFLFGVLMASCERKDPAAVAVEIASARQSQLPAPASPSSVALMPAGERIVEISDTSQVCMVNDQFMGRPQIPVSVESRTYYGCCPMCKQRIEADANVRVANDPISNHPVDKSTAVIGMLPDGRVLYFEKVEHLREYARRRT